MIRPRRILRSFLPALAIAATIAGQAMTADSWGTAPTGTVDTKRSCNTDFDCGAEEVCFSGRCVVPQCRTNADCGEALCQDYQCYPCTTPGRGLRCPAETYCLANGTCTTQRPPNEGCNSDKECLSGICVSSTVLPLPPGISPGKFSGVCGTNDRYPTCPSDYQRFGDHCSPLNNSSMPSAYVGTKLEKAQQTLDTAQEQLNTAQESATAAQGSYVEAKETYAEAKSTVAAAKEELAAAKAEYAATSKVLKKAEKRVTSAQTAYDKLSNAAGN